MDQEQATEIKFFDAGSRIGRARYLAYPWGVILLTLPIGVVAGIVAAFKLTFLAMAIFILVEIFALVMSGVFMVRRLHDFNRSGWWSLIYWALTLWNFVTTIHALLTNPLEPRPLNWVFVMLALVLVLIMVLMPGTQGSNRYGPMPPPNGIWVLVGAWMWLVVIVLGVLVGIAAPSLLAGNATLIQTSEAIQLGHNVEQAATAYHEHNKVWPADLTSLYPRNPDGGIGRYSAGITAITTTDGSSFGIMVTMKNTGVTPAVAGSSVELWTTDGRTWHCGPASINSMDPQYLPSTCRETGAP